MAAMALAPGAAAQAQTTIFPGCGSVIPAGDWVLGHNVICPFNNGLFMGSPNTKLSLNGKSIQADLAIIVYGNPGPRTISGPGSVLGFNNVGIAAGAGPVAIENLSAESVGASTAAIHLANSASGNVVRGNTVEAKNVRIYVHPTTGSTEIAGNTCIGTSGHGIRLDSGNHSVHDNVCAGPQTSVWLFNGPTGNRIFRNSGGPATDGNVNTCTANDWFLNSFTSASRPCMTENSGCDVLGTAGNDVLAGTSAADIICGLGGNDRLQGSAGNDLIDGGPGQDQIGGGAGDDSLYGGDGRDRVSPGTGDDVVAGGAGSDRASYSGVHSAGINGSLLTGVISSLAGGTAGSDTLTGFESLEGTSRADTLTAGIAGLRTKVLGLGGDDILHTADGDAKDSIAGGAGDDTCTKDAGDRASSC